MKLARVRIGTQVLLVEVDGDSGRPLGVDTMEPWFDPLRCYLHNGPLDVGRSVVSMEEVDILAPLRSPQKVIAVAGNYRAHLAETNSPTPVSPVLVGKAPSAICGPGDAIPVTEESTASVDYEGELGVVIGRRCKDLQPSEALDAVLGYTVANDVSARDLQALDRQFFRAKSFDGFCPLGPFIVTADEVGDPQGLRLRTTVDGDLRQDETTGDMLFSVAEIIAHASRGMTLEPGDLILTGTPSGVGSGRDPKAYLRPGQSVSITIDGIGTLTNPVVAG